MLERPQKKTKRKPAPGEPEQAAPLVPTLRESKAPDPPLLTPLRPRRVTLAALSARADQSQAASLDGRPLRRRARRRVKA
ncbi:hypothetical protein GO986_14810 [Deinococcus sp. HMF7620]|uniref:Uncharacterized protein n=1 Tax=Deinococcus arboris TaxID=2682977 RepID=A0A7C9M9Z5_9DEIO|nr:hypothetical protein [Deinococcus arboris]MVN88023.1 hypothetical protein [Deinococcus arboris]